MIVSDKQIVKKKQQLSIESLFEMLINQQEKQDSNIEKSLGSIRDSLKVIKEISKNAPTLDTKSFEKQIALMLTSMSEAILSIERARSKESIEILQKIKESLDQNPLINKLDEIGKNMSLKKSQWQFDIYRDGRRNIDKVIATPI